MTSTSSVRWYLQDSTADQVHGALHRGIYDVLLRRINSNAVYPVSDNINTAAGMFIRAWVRDSIRSSREELRQRWETTATQQ